MGRIKSTAVKRTAKKLLEEDENFSKDFKENKEKLKAHPLPDKQTRNKIAGYITRLKKKQK